MSGPSEQPDQSPGQSRPRAAGNDNNLSRNEVQQEVWAELFGIVHVLADTVQAALQAFTPTDDKAVSAITKKRLVLRSIHGLKQSQGSIETLVEHLKALQAASQTWQRSMMYASKSHQELMEQIESTTEELHKTSERLRGVEAQRLAAVREAELLRARTEQQEAVIQEARATLKQREEDLENLQFSVHELQSSSSVALQDLGRVRQEATLADERANAANAALDEVKAEAAKAHNLAERHQQVVAKLTADNLVFLMQLKKVEADLAAANHERAQLRLAAEQQRGPWFDQVRAGVEERVRQALQHSRELETRLERRVVEHAAEVEAMREQQANLEEELRKAQNRADELQQRLDSAGDSRKRAENLSAAAHTTAKELQKELDNLAAENRVLQESVRSMRQECTERWVHQQAALAKVNGLELQIGELQEALSQQIAQAVTLQQQLETQMGVNRQLMARKEEMEWQLMAAMAKIDGGAPDQPLPLNLRVSGLLQVGGPNQEQQRHGAGTPKNVPRSFGKLPATAGEPFDAASEDPNISSFFSDGPTATQSQMRPARALQDVGNLPHQALSIRRNSTVSSYSTVAIQGTGSGEPMRSPTDSKPSNSPYLNQHAIGAGLDIGKGGILPHKDRSMGQSESALLPESTVIITQEDSAVGALKGAHMDHATTASGHPGLHQDVYPQHVQPSKHISPIHAVGGDRVYAGDAGDTQAPARWTSLEGASTVVSSPPSSVALSTDPGSPSYAHSLLPSETSGRDPGPATVTIRTVSTGQQRTSGRETVASVGQDTESGGERQVPYVDRVKHVAAEDSAGYSGLSGQLARRGSLHEGGDVWLADAASTTSSDDSDFFPAGVIVQCTPHIADSRKAAQQEQLYQLQKQLHMHLQGPSDAVEAGGLVRQRVLRSAAPDDAMAPQAIPAKLQAPNDTHHSDDDDAIRGSALPRRKGDSVGVVIRTGFTVRSTSSRPATARPEIASGKHAAPVGKNTVDRDDPGSGMFSIVKGGGNQEAASRSGGSPLHPALSGKTAKAALDSHTSTAEPCPKDDTSRISSVHNQDVSSGGQSLPLHQEPAASAPADTDPVPGRVQAGPLFYATSSPLDSTAMAAMERWTRSTGGLAGGIGPAPIPALSKLQELAVPASPARSNASMWSPRSPIHPAIIVSVSKDSGGSAATAEATDKFPKAPGRSPATLGSSTGPAKQPVHPAAIGGVSSTGLNRVSEQAATGLQPLSSDNSTDDSVTSGAADGTPVRPRVSFHGLTEDRQTIAGASDGGGQTMGSSMSSSTGSLVQMSGTSGTQQAHKSNSMKSVRFSDHDPDGKMSQLQLRRREGQEHEGAGFAARVNVNRTSVTSNTSQDVPGRSMPPSESPTDAEKIWSGADSHESSQQYLSKGPVSHPAMVGVSTAIAALDAAEVTPAKRYSAAGVRTTTVPRATTGSS